MFKSLSLVKSCFGTISVLFLLTGQKEISATPGHLYFTQGHVSYQYEIPEGTKATLASTFAKLFGSDEALFDNITFPEEFQYFRDEDSNQSINQVEYLLQDEDKLLELYSNYKRLYRIEDEATREYDNEVEYMKKFGKNLLHIARHNSDVEKSYEQGVNEFTHLDLDEMLQRFTGFIPDPIRAISGNLNLELNTISPPPITYGSTTRNNTMNRKGGRKGIPKSKDWRRMGAVSSVKHQGDCGSCTLFSAAAALESSWFIWNGGKLLDLSEQQLLDCIPPGRGHDGCNGNTAESTLPYLKSNGLGLESSSPYKKKAGSCKKIATVAKAKDFYRLPKDEYKMKTYVALFGPIMAGIHVNEAFKQYRSGILSEECDGNIDHSVLIVGYGTEKGKDYWLIKNSWGTKFGEKGYIKLLRNTNMCNIALGTHSYLLTG